MAPLLTTIVSSKVKFCVPFLLGVFLVACGATPAIPLPPGAAVPSALPTSSSNPLAPLTGLTPNSDVGDALKGLGALSQLGNAVDQKGNVTDPNAMQNFLNTIQDLDKQQKARDFAQKESLDFPQNAPQILKNFAYASAKLTAMDDSSSTPNFDISLTYQTLDVMKTVGDFYKNLGKTLTGGWKITGQSADATEGSLSIQNKPANGEENLRVTWSDDAGLTLIRIRYWTNYNV